MIKNVKIYITNHRGLTGSALARSLTRACYTNLLLTHADMNLTINAATATCFTAEKPDKLRSQIL